MQIPRCAGRRGEDREERIGRSGVPGRRGERGILMVRRERGGEREGTRRGGLGVYYYLKGSGCCVQINKQEVIAEGLYIYFLS